VPVLVALFGCKFDMTVGKLDKVPGAAWGIKKNLWYTALRLETMAAWALASLRYFAMLFLARSLVHVLSQRHSSIPAVIEKVYRQYSYEYQ
jgi:hypothetical protein